MIQACEVVSLLLDASTPAQHKKAEQKMTAYIRQQEKSTGADPKRTAAALKAVVTRKINERNAQ